MLPQTMVYAAAVRTDLRLCLADILIFCFMVSQAVFMSLLSLTFSKVANLFEI